jgi:hypothetical protein
MDLQAAKLLNAKSWLWAKLAAFAFFAIAGALLVASLTSSHGPLAKAAAAGKPSIQLSDAAHAPVATTADKSRR